MHLRTDIYTFPYKKVLSNCSKGRLSIGNAMKQHIVNYAIKSIAV